MKRKQFWGMFLIIAPFVLIVVVLFLYAISSFWYNSVAQQAVSVNTESAANTNSLSFDTEIGLGATTPQTGTFLIIRAILTILGTIAVLGIPIGLIIGLILLLKKEKEPAVIKTLPVNNIQDQQKQ